MVGVFVLYLERNGSSDSPNKACVVHVILPIAVTWREVDEPTLKTPYCEVNKRKKKAKMHFWSLYFGPILDLIPKLI